MTNRSTGGRPDGRVPDRRAEVRRLLLSATEPLSILDLASSLELHPNTVRFHLTGLIKNGQVEQTTSVRRAPGRPPLVFRAVRGMDPAGPRNYQLLAEVLADALADAPDAHERALAAGRSWWRRHGTRLDQALGTAPTEPVTRLVALLDTMGFAPEADHEATPAKAPVGETTIDLRHCPFLELTTDNAADRTDVVCPIHLGLMQAAVRDWGSDVEVERLDPLVEPDRCVTHLARRGAAV